MIPATHFTISITILIKLNCLAWNCRKCSWCQRPVVVDSIIIRHPTYSYIYKCVNVSVSPCYIGNICKQRAVSLASDKWQMVNKCTAVRLCGQSQTVNNKKKKMWWFSCDALSQALFCNVKMRRASVWVCVCMDTKPSTILYIRNNCRKFHYV